MTTNATTPKNTTTARSKKINNPVSHFATSITTSKTSAFKSSIYIGLPSTILPRRNKFSNARSSL